MTSAARVFLYDAGGHDQEVPLTAQLLGNLTDEQLLWIDARSADPAELAQIFTTLQLDATVQQLGMDEKGAPRLARCGEFMHITLVALHFTSPDQWKPVRTSVLWDRRMVLTVHPTEVDAFEGFTTQARGETRIGALSADVFLSALLDWHLASYFTAIELIERSVDRFDEHVLTGEPSEDLVHDLVKLRRGVSRLRRLLLPQREVFHGLTRPDVAYDVGEQAARQFQSVGMRFERVREALEHAADLIQGSFSLHASRAADSANAFLKVLTFGTFLLGAMGVIAGMLGMNFQARLFEAGEPGFWTVVLSLASLAVVSVLVARRRKWI